jgi:hypothetical protein
MSIVNDTGIPDEKTISSGRDKRFIQTLQIDKNYLDQYCEQKLMLGKYAMS